MSLKDQLNDLRQQVTAGEQQVITSSQVSPTRPARSYIASGANFDQDAMFHNPFSQQGNTFRPMWKTQDAAIQQNKVITTNLPSAVTATGVSVSPTRSSATLGGVPDMNVAINVTAGTQVQVSWQFSGSMSTNTASATFVLMRDNVKIGQPAYGQSAGMFSLSQNYIDSPNPGLHSYAVFWGVSAGTLTADTKSRQITAIVLKPQ